MKKNNSGSILFGCLLCSALLTPTTALASGPTADRGKAHRHKETRELWTGALYSSTYRVGVCRAEDGQLRGVVHLRLRNGQVDVYHITGEARGRQIRAHHSSGHDFRGSLVSDDSVEGTITLKSGLRIRLEGRRTHDAPLDGECAPLPEP